MNWEALAAIGELLGAAGVIATLLYLAIQMRQNTRAMRSATLNAITASHQGELRWSSDISLAMRRAMHRPEEMTEDDTHQVTEWTTAAFLARENEFSQFRQGLLEQDKWEQSEMIVRLLAGIPWMQTWWAEYGRHIYTAEFVEWVDGVIAEGTFDTAAALKKLEGPGSYNGEDA